MKKIALIATALIASLTTFGQNWKVDKAHAKLGFTVEHMMVSDVEGWFKNFDATMTASKADFSDAVIDLTADAASVNTDNEKRDNHIKGADFFDVAKYPALTFKSKSFKKIDDKNYKLAGDLTMHGVTKPVVLDVVLKGTTTQMNSTKKKAGFKVTGTLKRKDFGIGAGMPTAVVGDDVTLIANIEMDEAGAL